MIFTVNNFSFAGISRDREYCEVGFCLSFVTRRMMKGALGTVWREDGMRVVILAKSSCVAWISDLHDECVRTSECTLRNKE